MKNLSKILAILALLLIHSNFAKAEIYTFDPNHTNINWHANHFGFSTVSGKFTKSTGQLDLDENNLDRSSLNVIIDTTSIITGSERFDNHLKSADFFNVKKYPTAEFKSTGIKIIDKSTAKIYGNFTLLGVSKPITLDAVLNKIGINPMNGKKTAGFSVGTSIKRSEFGMNYAVPAVSDDIKIDIEVETNIQN